MLTILPQFATVMVFSTADAPCDWHELPGDWLDAEARARGGDVDAILDALLVEIDEVCPGNSHSDWIDENYQRGLARSASSLLVHIAVGQASASDQELRDCANRLDADAILVLQPDETGRWDLRWLER
jgi:hypothetical protein